MGEDVGIGRFGEAVGVSFPDSDLDPLAVALRDQLERIRALDDLSMGDDFLSGCFDVRWDR
jgi:hypothetical protein